MCRRRLGIAACASTALAIALLGAPRSMRAADDFDKVHAEAGRLWYDKASLPSASLLPSLRWRTCSANRRRVRPCAFARHAKEKGVLPMLSAASGRLSPGSRIRRLVLVA